MARKKSVFFIPSIFDGSITRPPPPAPIKAPPLPKAPKKEKYEQKFRFSFSPRSVVGMGAPNNNYDREANFKLSRSSGGLVQMHGGLISSHSARKIRNAIDWLLAAAEDKYLYSKESNRFYTWRLSFLTLTLPTQGKLSDIEVKSILNSFLTLAKHNYGLKSYIWKAEPQSRGVIHFHLTSDCYMWKNSLRFEWNRLLAKSGLLNGHDDAPSTKIHSTYRTKNMAAYLCKYFIKPPAKFIQPPLANKYGGLAISFRGDPDAVYTDFVGIHYIRPITGRLWGCSQELSKARNFSFIVNVPEMRAINGELREAGAHETQKTYCNFFKLPPDYYDKLAYGQLKHEFNVRCLKIRKESVKDRYDIRGKDGLEIADRKIHRRLEKQLAKKSSGLS